MDFSKCGWRLKIGGTMHPNLSIGPYRAILVYDITWIKILAV